MVYACTVDHLKGQNFFTQFLVRCSREGGCSDVHQIYVSVFTFIHMATRGHTMFLLFPTWGGHPHCDLYTMRDCKNGIKRVLFSRDLQIHRELLCHRGKCHSGNCHSGERWMSRPFVHSGNLNFKHTLTNDLVFHNAWKRIICHFIT